MYDIYHIYQILEPIQSYIVILHAYIYYVSVE
jgi:hypothetical protein